LPRKETSFPPKNLRKTFAPLHLGGFALQKSFLGETFLILEQLSPRDSKVINLLITQLLTDFPNSMTQITLFGSKARGDDTEESDIDMLMITKNEVGDLKAQIRDVGYDLSLEYDVIFNLFPYTQERWNWMASIRHPLWRSIIAEGIDLTPELSPA
jgi:hypothetical protein